LSRNLDASDAFVALCTPDDRLEDGSVQSRQNITDEIQRALQKPHLRGRIQVFKDPSVQLPSNINPTYERLDVNDVAPVARLIVRQLDSWGVTGAEQPAPRAPSERPVAVSELIEGLGLGEHDEAERRAYRLLSSKSRAAHQATVAQLWQYVRDSDDTDQTLRAGSVLEAVNRLDPSLIGTGMIEALANSSDFSTRSSAATLLWDRAEAAPATVPLGLLGRLARPATEDWYVQAPAMAAAKQLLLRRRAARIIFDDLAKSPHSEDRYSAANALLDVAQFDIGAMPRDLAEALSQDGDELVAAKGREALEAIAGRPEEERDPLSPFGL
jgi:hypothetical protein